MKETLMISLVSATILFLTTSVQASEVSFSDPLPNVSAVKGADGNVTTPGSGGIGYEWSVTMGNNDSAQFTGAVGAKSSYEPAFVARGPDWAWTHTSNWVALDLTEDATVTINVHAQQGVQLVTQDKETKENTMSTAGYHLHPVVSVYKNWEETGVETGSFNPIGKASWQNELEYMGIAYADQGQMMITYTAQLPKGKYTLNIGGANAYEPNGCPETNTACYLGNHGYRAEIITGTGASMEHMH